VAIGISTSGNSPNVLEGMKAARVMGILTIALTGSAGGELVKMADIAILAPSRGVWQIQECHIALIHVICGGVEELVAGGLRKCVVGGREAMITQIGQGQKLWVPFMEGSRAPV
jgi:hypothetical protein